MEFKEETEGGDSETKKEVVFKLTPLLKLLPLRPDVTAPLHGSSALDALNGPLGSPDGLPR